MKAIISRQILNAFNCKTRVTTRSGSIKDHLALRMWFRIVGGATFKATQGDAPARVRLYMQRRGDNMLWTMRPIGRILHWARSGPCISRFRPPNR